MGREQSRIESHGVLRISGIQNAASMTAKEDTVNTANSDPNAFRCHQVSNCVVLYFWGNT